MNSLRLRIIGLVFRNSYTFFATIALLIGGIFLARYIVFVAYNQYARETFMKPFYEKVALAEQDNKALPLQHFVSRAVTHEVNTSSRNYGWVENCTVPGTYFDYQTHKQLNDVRFCSYGYISYFWVDALDAATIDRAAQQMQTAGWRLVDDAESQQVNKRRANTTMLGGYTFTRPDGVTANMLFINKQVQLQNSDTFSAYPYWDFVNQTKDPHNFFLAVDVTYATRMQGSRLLGN